MVEEASFPNQAPQKDLQSVELCEDGHYQDGG